MRQFNLTSEFTPKGDQPKAIEELSKSVQSNTPYQVLLGVTGSGKTFTVANIIQNIQRPTLVIAHNKTLAAQLYNEFKTFFPENAVEYFVSYYDYYQPEAYLPQTDTYIEKDSSINDEIDKMRHSATRSVLDRRDVIVISSVSCIYGLGSPETYNEMHLFLEEGMEIDREDLLAKLVDIHYERNDIDFKRGTFRVRGDVVEVIPAYEKQEAIRVELFGSHIDGISIIDPLRGGIIGRMKKAVIYPGSHYVTTKEIIKRAVEEIKEDLKERVACFESQNKLIEAQRIEQRTLFDLEMIEEIGYCQGIENYSRYLSGRGAGEPPPTLLEYFPDDLLIVIDESHASIPQIRGMYAGDQSRKRSLVNYGFRLPSAVDNRPLNFQEFERMAAQILFVSATPGPYELEKSGGCVVEQIVRPTGLVDPEVIIRPVKSQVDDLLHEIRKRVEKGERVLVTTLTKRFSEDLTEHYQEIGVRVKYLHSEIKTLERMEIIRDLRLGEFDVIIGINLLREGLDIPEVSLMAILDADKEGFLRSETSLIQTSGRVSRHVSGKVIMYADVVTRSMKSAIAEMERRRRVQLEYNKKYNITPESIKKSIHEIMGSVYEADYCTVPMVKEDIDVYGSPQEYRKIIKKLGKEMKAAAERLEFEQAAELRDRIKELEDRELGIS